MIRITKISKKYYGIEIDLDDREERDNIITFISEGTPVILVNSLEELEDIGIYEDVEMVEKS